MDDGSPSRAILTGIDVFISIRQKRPNSLRPKPTRPEGKKKAKKKKAKNKPKGVRPIR